MNPVRVKYGQGKLSQEVYVGQHHLIADEPVEDGGEDLGPSPFDFLGTALATCTAITLRLYAQRKNWPLENAEVTVTTRREKEGTYLTRKIELVGSLDPSQRTRLIEIANHCPVHKTLTGKIEIQTELVQSLQRS